MFCFVVPLAFVLRVSLVVVVVLLEAFWDPGNGEHFIISVVVSFHVLLNTSFYILISKQIGKEAAMKMGGFKG